MPAIYLRKAKQQDLDKIEQLIQGAKQKLAIDRIPQWQGNYPQKQDLLTDIKKGMTYLLILDQQIVGTATLLTTPDPNYRKIYQGTWRGSNEAYATIHRVAISGQQAGQHLGDFLFSNLMSVAVNLGFKEIRIDTHQQNLRMQHIIEKTKFFAAGIVYMDADPNDQRVVYQLFLETDV
ncbi:GNAT family N-acetyltransferase [Weissella coleopterorum]|uniref:GNAT family N-acetyltransferase n=1 Tax=Weissella coleopterorum TaxID=2714949 RepID=A0A6G8B1D7_9LACO|nr:GNAT family N-acetyltransferase [Weissella coleopterorum]QIL51050.1 GNAT family N-acetyltransferase [Weissella coleopterorum]